MSLKKIKFEHYKNRLEETQFDNKIKYLGKNKIKKVFIKIIKVYKKK